MTKERRVVVTKPEKGAATSICMHPETPAERQRFARKARSGKMVRAARGLYAPAEEWRKLDEIDQARHLAIALARLHPDWVFCMFTAAALYGLEIGRDHAMPLHVQTPHGGIRGSLPVIQYPLTCENPTLAAGVRVTEPVRTVVDCMRGLSFQRALAIADSALRVLGVTKEDLYAELATREQDERRCVAENAVKYASALAANGGESVARAVMIEQGFMIPELQVEFRDPINPSKRYYVDFLWRLKTGNVVGELDGKDKYVLPDMVGDKDTAQIVIDERHRESRLTAPGAKVLRFSFREVMDTDQFVSLLALYGIPRGPARTLNK